MMLPASRTAAEVPSPEKVLRRLFLTLFLRGRSVRQLQGKALPVSVARKLAGTLALYALFGCTALFMVRQPVFVFAAYLHAMTFVFLGMFVAASAGEVLFNKDEAEILLHRPIEPRTLLRAKVRVLIEVCLWLALAFNAAGLVAGLFISRGSWFFSPALALSLVLAAVFCTGCVVLVYQLCLRWFGRERLDSMMTAAQVAVAMVAVLGGQLLPQVMARLPVVSGVAQAPWWLMAFPPAWFAGLVDALAGSRSGSSWLMAVVAVAATGAVAWLAFGKLAQGYELGLQRLNETTARTRTRESGPGWLARLTGAPPLKWALRDPVVKASFLLTSAYLVRDRDVKLRVYPGLAPILVMPLVMLLPRLNSQAADGGFGVAFVGVYLGLVPLLALEMLQYSQNWQAADVFRVAPLPGPTRLNRGARRAVLLWLAMPVLLAVALLAVVLGGGPGQLPLLLPGIIALPVYALIPSLGGKAAPLASPPDESKSLSRGLSMVWVMGLSVALAAAAAWTWQAGLFGWLLALESLAMASLFMAFSLWESRAVWR